MKYPKVGDIMEMRGTNYPLPQPTSALFRATLLAVMGHTINCQRHY